MPSFEKGGIRKVAIQIMSKVLKEGKLEIRSGILSTKARVLKFFI